MLKAKGLDEAIIGVGSRGSQKDVLVYDVEKVIEILMTRDGMTYEEAEEFFNFNIGGGWYGKLSWLQWAVSSYPITKSFLPPPKSK